MSATTNIAQAGLRNWALNLHNTLADKSVFTENVAVNVFIGAAAPEPVPHAGGGVLSGAGHDLHGAGSSGQ